jgi:primosomal protein N' (replication factor Y)
MYRGATSALLLESETVISQNRCFLLMKAHFLMMSLIFQALQQQSSLKVQDIIAILNKKNIFQSFKTDR